MSERSQTDTATNEEKKTKKKPIVVASKKRNKKRGKRQRDKKNRRKEFPSAVPEQQPRLDEEGTVEMVNGVGGMVEGGSAVTVALSSFRQGRKNNERTV